MSIMPFIHAVIFILLLLLVNYVLAQFQGVPAIAHKIVWVIGLLVVVLYLVRAYGLA